MPCGSLLIISSIFCVANIPTTVFDVITFQTAPLQPISRSKFTVRLVCDVTGAHTFFICCPTENKDGARPLRTGRGLSYNQHYCMIEYKQVQCRVLRAHQRTVTHKYKPPKMLWSIIKPGEKGMNGFLGEEKACQPTCSALHYKETKGNKERSIYFNVLFFSKQETCRPSYFMSYQHSVNVKLKFNHIL